MTHHLLHPESTGEIPGEATVRLAFPEKTLYLAPFDPAAPPRTNATAETAIVRLPATALDTDIDVPLDFDPGPYPPVPPPVPPIPPDDAAETADVTLLQALGAQRQQLPIVPVRRWGSPEGIYPPIRVADPGLARMREPGDPGRRRAGAPRWALAAIAVGLALLAGSVGAAFALAWAVTW